MRSILYLKVKNLNQDKITNEQTLSSYVFILIFNSCFLFMLVLDINVKGFPQMSEIPG